MPKGPKGQKRPADVIGNAIKVARIATGEEAEQFTDDGKNLYAVGLGKRGGNARGRPSDSAPDVARILSDPEAPSSESE